MTLKATQATYSKNLWQVASYMDIEKRKLRQNKQNFYCLFEEGNCEYTEKNFIKNQREKEKERV